MIDESTNKEKIKLPSITIYHLVLPHYVSLRTIYYHLEGKTTSHYFSQYHAITIGYSVPHLVRRRVDNLVKSPSDYYSYYEENTIVCF